MENTTENKSTMTEHDTTLFSTIVNTQQELMINERPPKISKRLMDTIETCNSSVLSYFITAHVSSILTILIEKGVITSDEYTTRFFDTIHDPNSGIKTIEENREFIKKLIEMETSK